MKQLTPPAPPNWLGLDAQLKWREVWRLLDPSRYDTAAHADTVAIYCQAYAQWKEAVTKLESEELLIKSVSGALVANPLIRIRDDAARTIQDVGEMLGLRPDRGLTPVTRWDDVVAVLGGEDGDDDGDE